jgi:enamine deaminase RidA (YjgF/YER057c/UK114 family)
MKKTILNPKTLVKPSGYAHGILTSGGRLLFLAGQTGMDAAGRIAAPGDLLAQFTQVLTNLQTVVTEAGGEMTDIVKLTIFVTDKAAYHAQREAIGARYREFLGHYYPAMTLVEVKSLYDDAALIEIEGLAVLADHHGLFSI